MRGERRVGIGDASLKFIRTAATVSNSDFYRLERPGLYVIRATVVASVGDAVPPGGWRGMIEHPDVEFVVRAQE
jgi:hypothetical protein